jgi:hypothetical protein
MISLIPERRMAAGTRAGGFTERCSRVEWVDDASSGLDVLTSQ